MIAPPTPPSRHPSITRSTLTAAAAAASGQRERRVKCRPRARALAPRTTPRDERGDDGKPYRGHHKPRVPPPPVARRETSRVQPPRRNGHRPPEGGNYADV